MSAGIRYIVSVALAIVVTLAAFYLMYWLITGTSGDVDRDRPDSSIRFQQVEIDERIEYRDRRRPEPPPPPEEPPPPPQMQIDQIDQQPQPMPDLDLPQLDLAMQGTGPFMANIGQAERSGDGDFIPRVRINPQYPPDAARNGIEGYVTLEFTVDETGAVRNPRVIEARPPRVFDREALRAIVRWRFEPRVVDGQPVAATGRQTIEFNFDE